MHLDTWQTWRGSGNPKFFLPAGGPPREPPPARPPPRRGGGGGAPAAEARAVQRRAKAGELVRIADGIYVAESEPRAQEAVVRRNWHRILGALLPGAVVSHRSAHAGGVTADGVVFLSHPNSY